MDYISWMVLYTMVTFLVVGFGLGRLAAYFVPGPKNEDTNRINLVMGILIPGVWFAFYPIVSFSVTEWHLSHFSKMEITLSMIMDCYKTAWLQVGLALSAVILITGIIAGMLYGTWISRGNVKGKENDNSRASTEADADNETDTLPDQDDSMAHLEEMMAACCDCESYDCAYNKNGVCRLPYVANRGPEIDDHNGCLDYILNEK